MAGVADPETDVLPTSGTFRTSWRAQIANAAWGIAAVPVIGVVLWLSGDSFDPVLLVFLLGVGGVVVVGTLLLYPIRGVAEVRIDPEAVAVTKHNGLERRVERCDLLGAWQDKRWVLKTQDQKVTIWDEGFTSDDWFALSQMLYSWKLADRGPLPGVVLPDRVGADGPESVVFEVHRPVIPLIALAAFATALLGVGVVALPAYADGSWIEDPLVTVGFPLGGLVLARMLTRAFRTAVRRAAFFPEAVRFERVVGSAETIPYGNITDAHVAHVDTPRGTFYLGQRNVDVFVRLLHERLAEDQLSGRRWVSGLFWLQRWVWAVIVVGGLTIWIVLSRFAPSWWGLGEGPAQLLVGAGLLGFGVLLWMGNRLWTNRLLRDAPD